jgi:hypothetical protein
MFGNDMTWGSVAGMVAGGTLGSVLPNFNAVKGGAFKNAMAEIGFNTGRGALTGFASGLVQAGVDRDVSAIWRNTVGGAISGASTSLFNIGMFGAAQRVENSNLMGIRGEKPVFRSGGLASLFGGGGISWGRTAWANRRNHDVDRMFAHEAAHFDQQQRYGFANFYGRTIWEYLSVGFHNSYKTPGTLEFQAMGMEAGFIMRRNLPNVLRNFRI